MFFRDPEADDIMSGRRSLLIKTKISEQQIEKPYLCLDTILEIFQFLPRPNIQERINFMFLNREVRREIMVGMNPRLWRNCAIILMNSYMRADLSFVSKELVSKEEKLQMNVNTIKAFTYYIVLYQHYHRYFNAKFSGAENPLLFQNDVEKFLKKMKKFLLHTMKCNEELPKTNFSFHLYIIAKYAMRPVFSWHPLSSVPEPNFNLPKLSQQQRVLQVAQKSLQKERRKIQLAPLLLCLNILTCNIFKDSPRDGWVRIVQCGRAGVFYGLLGALALGIIPGIIFGIALYLSILPIPSFLLVGLLISSFCSPFLTIGIYASLMKLVQTNRHPYAYVPMPSPFISNKIKNIIFVREEGKRLVDFLVKLGVSKERNMNIEQHPQHSTETFGGTHSPIITEP